MSATAMARPTSPDGLHVADHDSQYSLNLDALPVGKDESSVEIEDEPVDLIDYVRTDEIDGPTDFTQNMEYWMGLKLPNVTKPVTMKGPGKLELEQYISSDEPLSSSGGESLGTPIREPLVVNSVPSSADIRGTISRESTASSSEESDGEQQTLHAQHRRSLTTIANVDGPSDQPSPSPTDKRRRHLQPSVEDFEDSNSNLRGGARSASSSALNESLRRRPGINHLRTASGSLPPSPTQSESDTVRSLEKALAQARAELDSFRRESQAAMQKLRNQHSIELSERDSMAIDLRDLAQKQESEFAKKTQQMVGLKEQNSSLRSKLDTSTNQMQELKDSVTALTKSTQEQLELQQQKFNNGVRDLEEQHARQVSQLQSTIRSQATRDAWQAQNPDVESELKKSHETIAEKTQQIDHLQKQLADRDNSLHLAQQRANEAETILEETAQAHQEDMTHEQQLHDMQVSGLEERARSLNNELNTTRQEAERAQQKLKECEEMLEAAQKELEDIEDTFEARDEQIKDLERQHNSAKSKIAVMEDALRRSENRILNITTDHENEVKELKAAHSQEKDDMIMHAEAAVIKVKDLVSKERKEVKRLREEASKVTTSKSSEHEELEDLRNELRIANDHVEDVETERNDLRKELEILEQARATAAQQAGDLVNDLEQARQNLKILEAENRAINDEINRELLKTVKAKELEWKNKFRAMDEELQIRGKLLMAQWGRKEVGPGDPQGYRYKYLVKNEFGI